MHRLGPILPSRLRPPPLLSLLVLAMLLLCSGCACRSFGPLSATPVERHFASIAASPPELRAFLTRMPKGADLHSHLSGAVYAESYLEWAAEDGLCLNTATGGLTAPPCTGDAVNATQGLSNPVLRAKALRALSMYEYAPALGLGHDRFFATFSLFSAASHNPIRIADMIAEVVSRAAAQNVLHVELMLTPASREIRDLSRKAGLDGGFATARQQLLDMGVADIARKVSAQLDALEGHLRAALSCDSDAPQPGCATSVRYICQVTRLGRPEQVFAQMILAHELARLDKRFVALTLVAPEDHPRSLADYSLHMRMLAYLNTLPDPVPVHLHAGELTMGAVRPRDLRFHVREAVDTARARRIGHGVSVMYEDGAEDLLARMARDRVAVEILLTSNAQILGVTGPDHPLRTYLKHSVPVVLSTDDEGVERTDLTNEYLRAVREHGLDYADLRRISRNALEYSFANGPSLWAKTYTQRAAPCENDVPRSGAVPDASCRELLAKSRKARLQWELEQRLATFENGFTRSPRK